MSGVLRKYASDDNPCAAPVKNKRDFVSDFKNKGTQLAHRINALFMSRKRVGAVNYILVSRRFYLLNRSKNNAFFQTV